MRATVLLAVLTAVTLNGCIADEDRSCGPALGGPAVVAEAFQHPYLAADTLASAIGDPRQGPWQGNKATTVSGSTLSVKENNRDFSAIAYEGTGTAPWGDDPRPALETVLDHLELSPSRIWEERPYSDGHLVVAQHALGDGVASGDRFAEEGVSDAFIRSFTSNDQVRHQLIINPWYDAIPGDVIVDADQAEDNLREWLRCSHPDRGSPHVELGVAALDGGPLYAIRELGWGHWFWVDHGGCGGDVVVDARSGHVIYEDPDPC